MLLEKDLIKLYVAILTKIPIEDSKETVINAMLSFVEGFYDAIKECRKREHNLAPTLDYLISHYSSDFQVRKFHSNLIFIQYIGVCSWWAVIISRRKKKKLSDWRKS